MGMGISWRILRKNEIAASTRLHGIHGIIRSSLIYLYGKERLALEKWHVSLGL